MMLMVEEQRFKQLQLIYQVSQIQSSAITDGIPIALQAVQIQVQITGKFV